MEMITNIQFDFDDHDPSCRPTRKEREQWHCPPFQLCLPFQLPSLPQFILVRQYVTFYSIDSWSFSFTKLYTKQISAQKTCSDGGYPGQGRHRQDCQALCRSNEPGCFLVNFHHCAAIAKKCETSCRGKYLNACVEHTTVSKQVIAATCAQYCN